MGRWVDGSMVAGEVEGGQKWSSFRQIRFLTEDDWIGGPADRWRTNPCRVINVIGITPKTKG